MLLSLSRRPCAATSYILNPYQTGKISQSNPPTHNIDSSIHSSSKTERPLSRNLLPRNTFRAVTDHPVENVAAFRCSVPTPNVKEKIKNVRMQKSKWVIKIHKYILGKSEYIHGSLSMRRQLEMLRFQAMSGVERSAFSGHEYRVIPFPALSLFGIGSNVVVKDSSFHSKSYTSNFYVSITQGSL